MQKLIHNVSEFSFSQESLTPMTRPQNVLMVRPTYFHVDNPINVHMRRLDGTLHELDKKKAMEQWEYLKNSYSNMGFQVFEVPAVQGLPDMVFCANQSFPFLDVHGRRQAVLSNMHNEIRHQEVPYIASFLKDQGYHVCSLRQEEGLFESMGDALWLPGYRFILGGYGFRSDEKVYQKLAQITQAPIALFKLNHPKFYHLDTCLSVLNSKTALACQDAFTSEGWLLLKSIIPSLIEVPLWEADFPYFACNAHCPDGSHVLLQKGCSVTMKFLLQEGFIPVELETSEFMKSGGSVFCMKLMFF